MYSLQNYLNTSVEDAGWSLKNLLNSNPVEALAMANSIIEATENKPNRKTLCKLAGTIKRKAEKTLKDKAL